MSIHREKQPYRSKLFQQDIVQKISAPDYFGVVLRCWHDAEDVPNPLSFADPLMRPLAYGEVGVTFLSHGSLRQILPESDLRLVDRTLQPGDYCKRSVDDVRSGVVTNTTVKAHLAHAISAVPVEGWRVVSDLEDKVDADIGDYVTYDDWIGQIIEVFDEAIVQISSGRLVRLPELGSRLNVGDSGSSILPPVPNTVQNLFGLLQGKSEDAKDTVIAVKHNAYAIAWLALNQSLERNVAEKKSRPQKFWSGEELGILTLIRGRFDLDMRVGDRVHLKDTTGLPMTEYGQDGDGAGAFQVTTCLVTETSTEVEVLWQDGAHEIVNSIDLIPYLNPDEYDCWPGDHVVWKNEESKQPAIVQSVDAIQRTALILFPDTGTIELASLLELDPHGNSDLDAGSDASFGVRRGDFVFIHPPETTNGLENPRVPRIGEIEPWIRGNPFEGGQFIGWRRELQELGLNIASQRSAGTLMEKKIQISTNAESKLFWCGEVTALNLDGTVEVTCFDWTIASYPLERLTKLYDGIEQLEDEWEDGASEGYRSFSDEGDRPWVMETDGTWRPEQTDAGNEWECVNDDMDVDEDEDVDIVQRNSSMEQGGTLIWSGEVSEFLTPETILIPNNKAECMEGLDTGQCLRDEICSPLDQCEVSTMLESADPHLEDHDETVWKRFGISSTAPLDHAFFSSSPSQPSKLFLGRLRREYHILATSLPDNILVRAYEDRTDLLRSLIIGPENTPYEDAPFVIDWMLDSNFPHSPPVAHFLSWTNGNGRVNPNLYEEGKVCLSILGTWTGDKNEIWSATRSSLLQAFVSIQGLVLVKEPWFCEPAYEKLRGTEEGTVNSRLYSEKAYVLSRGFVRRALEIPLGGLESEIAHLFYTKKRLHKVVQDAQRLIQKSKDGLEIPLDQDIAVPRLTAGGIIALERTLKRLCSFLDRCPT